MRPAPARTPPVVVLLAAAALALLLGPLLALGVRVPWERFPEVLSDPDTADLLRVTLLAAVWAAALTTLLGVPLALVIQHRPRGGRLIRLLVLLPLAMPPVVGGLALTAALGRRGVAAPLLDALGLQFAFAFPGVVLAHVFIALPFVVVTVDQALRQIDPEVPASAAGLGMRPGEILRKVTLPAAGSAVATGGGLAFARSLGEFGTTLTFAGSLPGVTRTMPLGVYLERETDPGAANALGVLLILLAVAVLAFAALPTLLRRVGEPRPRSIGGLDTGRLRALTAPPAGGMGVTVGGTVFPAGRITAVVGPNGSGKTTLMRLIAGRLRGAEVSVGDRPVDGPRFVPAADRGVVMLTQRPGLPATTTVAGAVTMATRDRDLTGRLLDAAGLAALADVPVPALSGGQAAQVALVRALGTRPAVLILDEPLAAVDVASAARWRRLLRAAAQDRTTLLVTHDAVDVAALSEHLVVLGHGAVSAAGPTSALLELPPDDFVAELSGLSRIPGTVTAQEVDTVTIQGQNLAVTGVFSPTLEETIRPGDAAVAVFPPEATTLRLPAGSDGPKESARNVWPGVVESVVSGTARSGTTVTVAVGDTRLTVPVTRRSVLELGLEPGTVVECVTKALAVRVHPGRPETEGETS